MNKKISNKLTLIYSLSLIIVCLIFYPILPNILNYPPDSINNAFQRSVETGLLYREQYWLLILVCFIVGHVFIKIKTRKIDKLDFNKFSEYHPGNVKLISSLFNLPYTIYLMNIIIPALSIILIYTLSEGQINSGTIKIALVFITMQLLVALVEFIYCKKLVSDMLKKMHISKKYLNTISSLKNKIFIILLPMILVALIFTALISYSINIDQKGEYMAIANQMLLDENITKDSYTYNEIYNIAENIMLLDNTNDIFIIFDIDDYTCIYNSELSDFFIKYTITQSSTHDNRTYAAFGVDYQGIVKEINIDGENAYIGILYNVSSIPMLHKLITSIFILFVLNCVVLYYVSLSLAKDTEQVANALKEIATNHSKATAAYLPITSNDEISQLIIYFNEIQELTLSNIQTIQNNQDMLVEQERLASLGQMIGGIAHNLKTPIFSVAGGLEGLSDLINEYDASIDNPSVTDQDMHEIAGDMREWIEKLKGHISYMSDIITTVKGQTVTLADNDSIEFSVAELFKRVDILMKHEIKNALATLKIQNNVGDSDLLTGNINSLVQIINNIISNSIEAYGNNYTDKIIELTANQDNSNLIISIKDYGPGISEIAQTKLFKEMITTKGKNGTGLGMFMSYSNIRAHFNGNLSYKTELGKGTTFYITLPIKNQP